jgi:hypothetical protein
MTTVIPFIPSNIVAPTFQATLDGNNYRIVVTWNVSAQRYYVNIYDMGGVWIVTVPLVQSPPSRAVEAVSYDIIRRVLTVQLVDSIYFPVPIGSNLTHPGVIVDYTLENFDPPVLNGLQRSLHINDTTFSFPLPDDPGQINILGSVARYMNMVGGIFITTTFIYRNGAFEINP